MSAGVCLVSTQMRPKEGGLWFFGGDFFLASIIEGENFGFWGVHFCGDFFGYFFVCFIHAFYRY
jgi:hypothetical protein